MTRIYDSISELPKTPAVYALYGGSGRSRRVVYVGIATKLRWRIEQHLVRRDSSVTSGTTAAHLNPDQVTEVEWWSHTRFWKKGGLEAAELIATDMLDPVLRSTKTPSNLARDVASGTEFRAEITKRLSAEPRGRLVLLTLEHAMDRIRELDGRLKKLEKQVGRMRRQK